MLVMKRLGGSSVAGSEKIISVVKRCLENYEEGHDVAVALSTTGRVTDKLAVQANEINPHPLKRKMDMSPVTGEQISVSLMAMMFHALGVPVVSLNAAQFPMVTIPAYGNAKLKRIETGHIRHELETRKIVTATGFQGINKYDDMTILGRGGSDTTAVALTAVPHAGVCEIYTDVKGVYTADSRIIPSAKKLQEVFYNEMSESASLGTKVLHNRSVKMAKKYRVKMVVRSSMTRAEGTTVKEGIKVERVLVSDVAVGKGVTHISVSGVKNVPDTAFKMFNLLAKNNINVDIIIQSVGQEDTKDISLTVAKQDPRDAVELLEKNQEVTTAQNVASEEGVAKLSITGAGMCSNSGVATKIFEALYNADMDIKMIATSEIRATVLVAGEDVGRTMRAAHDTFDLAD